MGIGYTVLLGFRAKCWIPLKTVINTTAPAVLKVCLTLSLLNANVEYVLPVLCDAQTLYRACFPEDGIQLYFPFRMDFKATSDMKPPYCHCKV